MQTSLVPGLHTDIVNNTASCCPKVKGLERKKKIQNLVSALVSREVLSKAECVRGHVQFKPGENSWGHCRRVRWVLCGTSDAASARESRGHPNALRLRAEEAAF